MQEKFYNGAIKKLFVITIIALALFGIDRVLKAVALEGFTLKNSLFSFALFKNEGIIFSLPLHNALFWPIAIIIFFGLVGFLITAFSKERASALAVFFIILGAISNLTDRVFYNATIDYFIFFGVSAVNIADGMILGGIMGLLLAKRQQK